MSNATTSGTTTFTMDVDSIIEQAMVPIGGEHTSGEDAAKARIALNLILIKLQNKNIPLNKVDTVTVALVEDTVSYNLPASVVDVLEATVVKDDEVTYIGLESYGSKQYHEIPNKGIKQRPNVYHVSRQTSGAVLKVWPVPPDDTYTLNLLCSKRIEDVTASYQKIDISHRYLPLIVDWLSYELSLGRVGITPDVRAELKAKYDEALTDAFEEDRERSDFTVVPAINSPL